MVCSGLWPQRLPVQVRSLTLSESKDDANFYIASLAFFLAIRPLYEGFDQDFASRPVLCAALTDPTLNTLRQPPRWQA
jgi:hypothetical protein